MNWKTFFALLSRDGHVARRNLVFTLVQNLLQPLLLTFVFGRILTSSGMMSTAYKNVLLPGIIGTSMVMSGVWAVAMPLIAEFQWTKEIEDRLLAPIEIGWLAVEKVIAGMIQALVAGLVVIPSAWLVMGSGVNISFQSPFLFLLICFLVALFAAAGGLALGCSIGQAQVGLMFSLVIAPMIMFGCAYYPWAALKHFPGLQYAVLINPLVYASEGLRGALVPGIPHISLLAVVGALVLINVILLAVGMKQFYAKSIG
ncbi:MAG TPA: ABC transporter permease [Bryobacteraceae bacterium]|nr:ABC transporter permease [Bryobacteraceae bacterium]